MPIDMTRIKNANKQDLYKVIRRTVLLNAKDDKKGSMSTYEFWQWFKKNVQVTIIPVKDAWKYSEFFSHLKLGDRTSTGMPWGKAGKNEIIWAINDNYNPLGFYIRQNVPPGVHEILHIIYAKAIGTKHIEYQRPEPPEVKRLPKKGPAATVIVHDNWYGYKTKVKMWISWGVMYLPLSIPYIPIKIARKMYKL